MAQYDDDEHALQVSMGAGSIIISVFCHTFRKQPASVAAIVNRCAVSISKLALENGINANLLFKWRQQWREGKLLLPSSESPQLLPVTLDAAAEQPESLAEDPETLSISCEVTFRHGTLRFNGNVSEKLLTLLIQELKR